MVSNYSLSGKENLWAFSKKTYTKAVGKLQIYQLHFVRLPKSANKQHFCRLRIPDLKKTLPSVWNLSWTYHETNPSFFMKWHLFRTYQQSYMDSINGIKVKEPTFIMKNLPSSSNLLKVKILISI